ncbi:type 1 glutamine amidotransferase domain-containing protein [Kitasatospora cineracea]|uniref:Intracellular protease/amidase n=1 Tax=Kitasatospora cineracea TaxID=88074 RepID=A0A3N4RSK1_9ACTN|nr:type 1 glutamine amidotransferase domain-containing protein [Kitasatospora cineracea]RPE36368.1 putative intracellular protease/amidase [Kitasatospora cineracea]
MAAPGRALFVVSAADHWTLRDGTRHPSGYWGEELAVPHREFTAAGRQVTLATPGGRPPTLDRLSMSRTAGLPRTLREVSAYLGSIRAELARPVALEAVDPDDFDTVFYPGGHGPMEDLAQDPVSGALLTRVLRSGRPLGLLCHAPAALLAARDEGGSWPFTGYRMTALSNTEEKLNSFGRKAAWLLEDRLRAEGAHYVKGRLPLLPFTTADRNLHTGQNPASSARLAAQLLAALAR